MLEFLQRYRDRGLLDGVCQTYLRGIVRCSTKKAAADLLLSVQGVQYIAPLIAQGKVTAEDLRADLGMFADGRYVYDADGYTSSFHIGRTDEFTVDTALVLAVECRRIIVPQYHVCEIHAVGPCAVAGLGKATVYRYNTDGTYHTERHGL